ncbi:MAG: phage portal protein [Clostridia bacterium]
MNLSAFFAQNAKKIDKEKYVPSKRFLDGENVLEWELICITALENNAIRDSCYKMVINPKRGEESRVLDTGLYQAKITARCVAFPNLEDMELQNSYGVRTSEDLIRTMLSPGEFENLSEKVLEINGFKSENELVDIAKN